MSETEEPSAKRVKLEPEGKSKIKSFENRAKIVCFFRGNREC